MHKSKANPLRQNGSKSEKKSELVLFNMERKMAVIPIANSAKYYGFLLERESNQFGLTRL